MTSTLHFLSTEACSSCTFLPIGPSWHRGNANGPKVQTWKIFQLCSWSLKKGWYFFCFAIGFRVDSVDLDRSSMAFFSGLKNAIRFLKVQMCTSRFLFLWLEFVGIWNAEAVERGAVSYPVCKNRGWSIRFWRPLDWMLLQDRTWFGKSQSV